MGPGANTVRNGEKELKIMGVEKELLDLKDRIGKAQKQISELQGKHQYLMEQLEKDWGCKTVEEAEERIESLNHEIDTLNANIESALDEIKEKYNV